MSFLRAWVPSAKKKCNLIQIAQAAAFVTSVASPWVVYLLEMLRDSSTEVNNMSVKCQAL
jgi:hypothetical protein